MIKKKQSEIGLLANKTQTEFRERWYGKPDSLLAQTLQKLKRKDRQEKLVFKLPKN
jgi:hypothetical protein